MQELFHEVAAYKGFPVHLAEVRDANLAMSSLLQTPKFCFILHPSVEIDSQYLVEFTVYKVERFGQQVVLIHSKNTCTSVPVYVAS
jgi:hypothetical protein